MIIDERQSLKSVSLKVFMQEYILTFDDQVEYDAVLASLRKRELLPSAVPAEAEKYLSANNLAYSDQCVEKDVEEAISGAEFYCYAYNLVTNKWVMEKGETQLTRLLSEPEGNLNILQGWTLEYFHVTKYAVHCLCPILLNDLPVWALQAAADFIADELFHEKLMANSFTGTILEGQLDKVMPLPSTLAYVDHLRVMASNRPNSFFASLFFYEGEDDDLLALADTIPDYGLYSPIRESHMAHAKINSNGGHSDVSKEYFSKIPRLTCWEREVILRDLKYLVSLYYRMQEEVLAYYSENGIEARIMS